MGDPDFTARIWNAQTGEEIANFEQAPGRDWMFGFMHPFMPLVAVPEPLRFWNYETGDVRLFTEDFAEDSVGQWSPDGQYLYLMSFGAPDYAVYATETGERVLSSTLSGCDFVTPGTWSPDSRKIAHSCIAVGSTPLVVTDAQTGDVVRELNGHTDGVMAPAWSPDGTRLAVGSPDGTVIVWDFQGGEILTVFAGHTDWVFNQSWSPDGSRIVSGDVTGSVRIWDVDSGREVNSWHMPDRVTETLWSPLGNQIVTTGQFPVPEIRPVWQTTEDLIDYAYSCCVFRELTVDEREQFGLLHRELVAPKQS
jgi:WD40 repeat protein